MNRISQYLAAALLLASAGVAADSPRLALLMRHGLQAGVLNDGTALGKGILISQDAHVGFLLRSDPSVASLQYGHYILVGKQNRAHLLRVRLAPQRCGEAGGSGMVLLSSGDRAVFDVLADGNQSVEADSYALNVRAQLLLR